jgi:hypothetical protein
LAFLGAGTGGVIVEPETIERRVELVAQAIHEAQPQACSWDAEPAIRREHFRECARNAIKLLDDDIGVLLLALKEAAAERRRIESLFNPAHKSAAGVVDTSAE